MFCVLLCVHYSFAIISMGNRELVALLCLSSWCLMIVERLFLTMPRGCLQLVILVFPDLTHFLFLVNFVCTVFELGDKMILLPSMENLIVHCNRLISRASYFGPSGFDE